MAMAVNAGGRLDRLPISSFHYRIFWLVGAGMFFDGYDLYVGTAVLPALLQSKFSTLAQNAQFVSFTFFGMTIGALVTGFLGDRLAGVSPISSIWRSSDWHRWRQRLHRISRH